MSEATSSSLQLDDQLCFALYAASRAMTARYRPLLDDIGLTYPQFLVMLVLWESDSATVTELGEKLRLDSGTLSPLLKRLETNGLVRRERRLEDERSVLVKLTTEGAELRDAAAAIPSQIGPLLTGIDHERLKVELRDLEVVLRDQ